MNTFYRMSAVVVLTGLACAVASAQTPSPSDDIAYALFYGNPDRPTLKGNATDAPAAKEVQRLVGAKFMMWFKFDGKAYVAQGMTTMDRLNRLSSMKAWQPSGVESAERYRQENAAWAVANPASVLESKAVEFRQLSEDIRQMASLPLTKDQDVTELQKRVRAMADVVQEMQRQVIGRATGVNTLQSIERSLQETGTERQILSEAIASGKVQPAP
jgi:hypothetical protein